MPEPAVLDGDECATPFETAERILAKCRKRRLAGVADVETLARLIGELVLSGAADARELKLLDAEAGLKQLAARVAELEAERDGEPQWRYRAFGPDNEIVLDPGGGERWAMTELGGWRIERQPIYSGPWGTAPDLVEGGDDA